MMAHHDEAYDVLEDATVGNDTFSNILRNLCSFTANTRRVMYAAGLISMEALVECFPTHSSLDKFVENLARNNGQTIKVPLFGDPNADSQSFVFCFPLIQQSRFRALRLVAVCHSYSDVAFGLFNLDDQKLKLFSTLSVYITTAKKTTDILEASIPVLSASGDAVENYSIWKQKFVDFLGAFRSCYTGTPLSYLLREDDAPPFVNNVKEYESFDLYLTAMMSLEPDVNLAFNDENKILASVLTKALVGTSYPMAHGLASYLGKGQGRIAWNTLQVRSAKALLSRVPALELKLKTPFTGQGRRSIQTHNSSFNNTAQNLAAAGQAITKHRLIYDYLMTIQDTTLVSLKEMIRMEDTTLERLQENFVNVLEGRKDDLIAQQNANRKRKRNNTRPF